MGEIREGFWVGFSRELAKVSRKIPSKSLIAGSRSSRGVLRMVFHNHGVLHDVSEFASQMPASGRFFFRSTKISPRAPGRRRVPAAVGCTAPTILGSRGAVPMICPKQYGYRLSFCCDRDGLPQEGDAAVGAVSRPEGLPRGRGDLGGRHAARAVAAAGPRAFQALRRRPADHRSMAGLLGRALSADAVLEGRSRSAGAGRRDRQPSSIAAGSVRPRRRCRSRAGRGCFEFLSPISIAGGLEIKVLR